MEQSASKRGLASQLFMPPVAAQRRLGMGPTSRHHLQAVAPCTGKDRLGMMQEGLGVMHPGVPMSHTVAPLLAPPGPPAAALRPSSPTLPSASARVCS